MGTLAACLWRRRKRRKRPKSNFSPFAIINSPGKRGGEEREGGETQDEKWKKQRRRRRPLGVGGGFPESSSVRYARSKEGGKQTKNLRIVEQNFPTFQLCTPQKELNASGTTLCLYKLTAVNLMLEGMKEGGRATMEKKGGREEAERRGERQISCFLASFLPFALQERTEEEERGHKQQPRPAAENGGVDFLAPLIFFAAAVSYTGRDGGKGEGASEKSWQLADKKRT